MFLTVAILGAMIAVWLLLGSDDSGEAVIDNVGTTSSTVDEPVTTDGRAVLVNTAGGPYEECSPTPTEPAAAFWMVEEGQSLSSIAAEVYGLPAPRFYLAIFEQTNARAAAGESADGRAYTPIDRVDLIFPGMVLHLPTVDDVSPNQTDDEAQLDGATVDALGGNFAVGGSSTVFPLSVRVSECLVNAGYGGTINLSSDGSLTGLRRLCDNDIDILDASVALRVSDIPADCAVDPTDPDQVAQIHIGYDAVVVAVSAENPRFADLDQRPDVVLADLLAGADDWSAVGTDGDALAEGGINRYFPSAGSGTAQFVAEVLTGTDLNAASGVLDRCDGEPLDREDDAALAACLAADPNGVGFIPYRSYLEAGDALIALPVGGSAPAPETVELSADERYDLLRRLYLYVPNDSLARTDGVSDFVRFYLANVNEVAVEQNVLPLSTADLERSIEQFCALDGAACT